VANRPPVSMPKLTRRSRILLIIAAVVVLTFVLGSRLIGTYIDWLWYGEVNARGVFTTVLFTRVVLFLLVGLLVAGAVFVSLLIAYRNRPVFVPVASQEDPLARYRSTVVARVRLFGIGLPAFAGIVAGLSAQGDWETVQLFLNGGEFGKADPEFGNDIGFYVFDLPFYNWLLTYVFVALVAAFLAAVAVHYLFGGIRLAGKGGSLTNAARIQLAVTAGIFVLVLAVDYYFDRYNLLLAGRNDLFTGASYTDLAAVMPAKLILMSIAVICAAMLFVGAFLRNLVLPAIALVLLLVSGILVGQAYPALLWQFSVKPNEIAKEAEPIARNMEATKFAYGLDNVKYDDYEPKETATRETIAPEKETISKIRLLDPSVLEPTFTNLVAKENFYGFPEKLDVDRYTVDGKTQDYIVTARELKSEGLAENQRSWINQRMVYTHGNGFVAAPANTINRAVSDGAESAGSEGGYPIAERADTATPEAFGIKVEQPRVYYGELFGEDDYAIVGNPKGNEFDTAEKTHRYQGKGGVSVDGLFHRLVFSIAHGERNILFNDDIGNGSKIMYNRDPRHRVEKKAPWLTVDGDPYPAVIDGRIKWIVDGYTTTANFPYGQKQELGEATQDTLTGVARHENEPISYIRNSVKATVDAYDGTTTLYSIDDKDPVLNAWRGVFPGTVEDSSKVTEELRSHFRYPEDMFKVQRDLLTKYHVKTPQQFFSNTQWWSVPPNPTEEGSVNQPPYYLLMKGPGDEKATFQLTSALTPLRRNYLASWMTVSSDPENYGEMRVLRLPAGDKVQQSKGPRQVQNSFDQAFAQERTLFGNPDVEIHKGNQLTLPVAGGFLYVEPIYIRQRNADGFPQLARVLVSFGNQVGFAETLQEALDQALPGTGASDLATAPQEDADEKPGKEPPGEGQPGDEPPQTPTPPQGNAALQAAADDMEAAAARYFEARKENKFDEEAKALADLEDAYQAYQNAKNPRRNGGN
jgi:uncharacterized membrane protein (UPF0182 family)